MLPLILAAGLALSPLASGATRGDSLAEYGLTCSLLGRLQDAERAYVALLSSTPGDPRALNGLGNLALLRSDAALAERCYAAAERIDPADPGLRLNRAIALQLDGDSLAAEQEAARGIALAGGAHAAAELLGLTAQDVPPEARGAARLPFGAAALRDFLERVSRRLTVLLAPRPDPSPGPGVQAMAGDTSRVEATAPDSLRADSLQVVPRRHLKPPMVRNLVTRSARPDATELANSLYWKR